MAKSAVLLCTVVFAAVNVYWHSDDDSATAAGNQTAAATSTKRRNFCHFTLEHDRARDQRLFSFCGAMYADNDAALENWTCAWCRDRLPNFQLGSVVYARKYNTKAAVGFDPKLNATVLAFRGTTTNDVDTDAKNKNWLMVNLNGLDLGNLTCRPRHIGKSVPGHVYCGFYKAYVSMRRDVMAAVRAAVALRPDSPLLVTGHSMGGTLASLAALEIRVRRIHKRPELINFGTPGIASPGLAAYFSCQVRRSIHVYNLWDPVPYTLELLDWTRHLGKAKVAGTQVHLGLGGHSVYLGVDLYDP